MTTRRTALFPGLTLVGLTLLACHPHGDAGGEPSASGEPTVHVEGQGADADDEGADAEGAVGYPGELISTDDMGRDFLARQKLEGTYLEGHEGERKFKFEAVLQLRGGTLTVLGLTPFGTKAFVLTQTGTQVEFEALIDREIPFPPEYMLQDIHRAWLWHARLPWGDAPPAEDAPTTEVAGERVTEQWSENGLVRRTFTRLDGRPAGEIRIDYVGGQRTGRPAKRVILDNGWFGYRLEITTSDWRML